MPCGMVPLSLPLPPVWFPRGIHHKETQTKRWLAALTGRRTATSLALHLYAMTMQSAPLALTSTSLVPLAHHNSVVGKGGCGPWEGGPWRPIESGGATAHHQPAFQGPNGSVSRPSSDSLPGICVIHDRCKSRLPGLCGCGVLRQVGEGITSKWSEGRRLFWLFMRVEATRLVLGIGGRWKMVSVSKRILP